MIRIYWTLANNRRWLFKP